MLQTNYGSGQIKVDMPKKGIFHVRISASDTFRESLLNRYGILQGEDVPALYEVTTDSQSASLCDGRYTMRVSGEQQVLTCAGSKRPISLKAKACGGGFVLDIPMTQTERLFGLGDESREGVMKRGRTATMWQKNVITYGPIPFLVSSEGWGLLMNCTYKHTYDLGKTDTENIRIEAAKGGLDFYLFLADSMKEIISLYTDISGKPIMLPKAAYGLTFVCNEEEGARELLENCLSFRREDIPCDVMGLEPSWMETHYDYSLQKKWNSEKFYIPYWIKPTKENTWTFFYNLGKLGYEFTLWLCCDYDLFWHEEGNTPEHIEEYSIDGADILDDHFAGNAVVMDKITNPKEPWFEHLKQFVDEGAAGFKLDGAMQVMEHPDRIWGGKYLDDEVHNLYPVVYVKQMQEGYKEYTGKRALIYTPSLYAGTQRYAASWAGDTGGGAGIVPYIMNMSFCGHSNASCDMLVTDPVGIHFGFLAPWSQILGWRNWHHPWFLGKELEGIIRDYSKLRSSLFPYIYSMAHYASQTGISIARPLSLVYEDVPAYDAVNNMYMFGDSFLVGVFDMRLTLPEGTWLDWFTGDIYVGGCTMDYAVPKGKGGALFVRDGSIFVTQPPKDYLTEEEPEQYTVNIFPGRDCAFRFVQDDGITHAYADGDYGCTEMTVTDSTEHGFTLTVGERIIPSGNKIELPEVTDLLVKIYGAEKPIAVSACGEQVASIYDEETHVASFVITKEQRLSGAVVCKVCDSVKETRI